jgi:citrate lyase subunit alpha/citrate CoA-transferase
MMGASGGHSDTAAGANLAVVVVPLLRNRLPMIRDRVHTIVTPGESVDVIVTEYGIAVNPLRQDILANLQNKGLPLKTIEELQEIAYNLAGKPEEIEVSDEIVAIVEYRDGTVLDVIRKPL